MGTKQNTSSSINPHSIPQRTKINKTYEQKQSQVRIELVDNLDKNTTNQEMGIDLHIIKLS